MKNTFFDVKVRKALIPFLIISLLILMFSCRNENESREADDMQMQDMETDTVTTTNTSQVETHTYTGDITSINTSANADTEVSGNVELLVEGDLMRIIVTAEGLAPDMMHMQHLQTPARGQATSCPEQDDDANNDGLIDVSEISPNAEGIFMIPLHMGPSSLEMNVGTYPRTNVNGELQFSRTVSLDSLRSAVSEEYGMQELDFTDFTYVIQGVAENASIPQSAQSASNVPVHQSIPVGCAKLEE